ncbi:MAG: YcaO-like family protein [Deltaproteobacteria bacterium]|nr:YcaO-like family protein [Deltaproteobacteria bacterium]
MVKISLKTCPKVYILETHRSKTPESTLRFIEKVKETAGMLSFRNASDVDRIGIPVFTCDRIRPDGSKTSHTGKGVSPIQAQVSITMEAIERYCSEFREEYGGKLVRGSFALLKKNSNVLDPQELILSHLSNYQHDKEIDWIWGHDLSKDEEILVPACAVYHPFHQDGAFLFSTHTNGIAAGNTYEEAIIHGLAELIERDAWSIARYTHNFNDALFLEDEPGNRFIIDVLERFEKADIEIVTKDLTTDIDVPVVAAFSRDLVYREMFPIDGFGAHLDPRVAMVRALLEIATTRALFLQKYGLEGLCETSPLYLQQGEGYEDDPRFYAHHQKSLRELDRGYSDDILQDVRTMIARLSARGLHRVIAVDLWRDDIGMPTVRMIVPGLEIYRFDQTRTGKRADQFLAE